MNTNTNLDSFSVIPYQLFFKDTPLRSLEEIRTNILELELQTEGLAALRAEDRLTPDLVFRDPYFLDFLGLKDTFSEKDLELSILREMESFILELGVGFSFVARQRGSQSTMRIIILICSFFTAN